MPQYGGIWTLSQVAQAVKNNTWEGVPPTSIEYLVVAGGGGSGAGIDTGGNGGGGAGGFRQDFTSVSPGVSYYITVGGGGAGSSTNGVAGTTGTNSSFGEFGAGSAAIISLGGGGGGSAASSYAGVPGIGGSGGGGWGLDSSSYPQYSGSAGTNEQGNRGGDGYKNNNGYGAGGGGGGAGSPGGHANAYVAGGNGGMGAASDITGVRTMYAGGGGGGVDSRNSVGYQDISSTIIYTPAGGLGGGGNGAYGGTTAPTAGSPNTGGGAGGGAIGYLGSKSGGSGIVVVRYPGNIQYYTGGTVAYNNGYISHTFYSSGTLASTTPTLFTNPDYQISRSLRFNSADGPILERAGSAGGNRQTWTWSGWVKRSKLNSSNTNPPVFFGASDRSAGSALLQFGLYGSDSGIDCINFNEQSGGSYNITTIAKFRDMSAWYHIVCAYDTTQSTASDRVKIYVNGVLQAITSGSTYPTQNTNGYVNYSAFPYFIGAYDTGTTNYTTNGYITEVNFIDGQQLGPGSFGYVDPNTGVWSPSRYVGSYGTRGFYLNFADNSNITAGTLGKDLSGNANNFTPTNLSVTAGVGNDSFVDSPTNYGTDTGAGGEVRGNYATLNRLDLPGSNNTLANGNLDNSMSVGGQYGTAVSSISVSSGKWYAEFTMAGTTGFIGVSTSAYQNTIANNEGYNGKFWYTTNGYAYYSGDGNKYRSNTNAAYGATYTTGDIIGVALDLDAGTLVFYKNGASQGTAYTGLSGTFTINATSVSGVTISANFGQRPFAYTAPSGYKALCTQNLPTPTIGSTSATLATKFMGVDSWSATDSTARSINTGVDMATYGGLLWIKNRPITLDHYLVDTVRGFTKYFATNKTDAENTGDIQLVSTPYGVTFNTGSASLNQAAQGYTWVGWNWAAGGAAVTNTTGSISAQVSANPLSGFSIVTYTGTGSNATVGHGLGVAPSMFIVKRRSDSENWCTYHQSLGATKALFFNLTDAETTNSVFFNNTAPTSSVFSIGTNPSINSNTSTYVAYCWAEVPGFSRISSYTGNGSTDGPFVYCGFRPRWIMFKRTTATENWTIFDTVRDPYNIAGRRIHPSLNSAETDDTAGTTIIADILSNGFKIKGTGVNINGSGDTYIFAAFAESPFKYSRAR